MLTGAVIGGLAVQISRHIDEPSIEIALSVIAAYGSFAIAEEIGCSGIIATVTAGPLCGTYG